MTEVSIVYNAFLYSMKIHIDGRPIPPISRLTRFQSMPFDRWCSEIFGAIAEEVNDQFSVVYMGRPCESHILSSYMATCSFCNSYVNRQTDIPDSALTRLKKLSSLCQSGVSCEKFSAQVPIYTDQDPEELDRLVRECLPKLAFCRILPKVQPLAEFSGYREKCPAFVICQAGTAVPRSGASLAAVLMVGKENSFVSCRDGILTEQVRQDMLGSMLKSYLELLLYPYLLNRALAAVKTPESSPLYPSVCILDKTEPQTLVTLPASIEFGKVEEVKIRVIPEGSKPAELTYRISDESVIRRSGNKLQAVGTGEAVVEVYVAGQTVKLCSGKITAYRRRRIEYIKVQEKEFHLCVGDEAALTYTFSPQDADNVRALKLVSSDGTVAAPTRGAVFVARRPGICRIYVEAERASDSVPVTVYPRLEGLKLELETDKTKVGSVVPLKVTRIPEDATLNKLSYRVEPAALGIYDTATNSFYAKGSGRGRVVVSDASGKISAACDVTVSPKPNAKGCLGTVLGILSFIAAVIAIII